jgi:hypothetical protein
LVPSSLRSQAFVPGWLFVMTSESVFHALVTGRLATALLTKFVSGSPFVTEADTLLLHAASPTLTGLLLTPPAQNVELLVLK